MQRLRIAYAAIHANRSDGSARAVNEVAERLSHRHEVHLFARTVADLDLSRIRWHRMPGPRRPAVADFLSYHLLAELRIRAHHFDIVHSIGNNAAAASVITIQNIQPAKRPFLARAGTRVGPARRMTRWLFLTITSRAEDRVYSAQPKPAKPLPLFLPVSRGVERDLRKHYAIGPAPVRIVPNGADTTLFRPSSAEEKDRWRQANGISSEDMVLAFAGGEWHRKGLEFALEALARIPQKSVKLLVLGDDPEAAHFTEMASRLGVRSRVVFAGFRRDIAQGLGASDAFLFPSRYEAFSLATIEAAACGLPILATRINGAEDFITPGHNGYFIEHDPEQIARTVQGLLHTPDLRQAMGRAARRQVEQRYTWDRVADLTESAYFEYLSSGGRKGTTETPLGKVNSQR